MGPAGRVAAVVSHPPSRDLGVPAAVPIGIFHGVRFRFADREKLDGEAHWSDWLDLVFDLGRYCLGRAGADHELELGLGPSNKA